MAIQNSLRELLDLESILTGDILTCGRGQTGGGGSVFSGLLSCVMGQKQKMTTDVAKSLPIGAIVEVGRALDIDTRRRLMFANKLFMEAFAPFERDETRRIYAAHVLKQTWKELLGSAADKRYMVFLEFEARVPLRVIVLPSRVRFIVPLGSKHVLETAFPSAVGIEDPVDDEFIIGLHVSQGGQNTDLSNTENTCSPEMLVERIIELSRGMRLLPPAAYIQNPSWLQRIKKLVGRREDNATPVMKPVFDKLSLYHLDG